MEATPRVPSATYRLQFSRRFGFEDARRILPYLDALGIDTIYASPIFRPRPGSSHGYDTVDPNEINTELGTEGDFELLMEAVRERGMGWIQDIIPNHMAFHHDNYMLMNILKRGEESRFRRHFDIDWRHPEPRLRGKVMAPFLERPLEDCLRSGEFQLGMGEVGLFVTYKHCAFPLHIGTYQEVLRPEPAALMAGYDGDTDVKRVIDAAVGLKELSADSTPAGNVRVDREIALMWRLYSESESAREFISKRMACFTGDAMRTLLGRQHFTLACYEDAREAINYRRFFDVNRFIALNAGRDEVFTDTHALVSDLVKAGKITGLRIDHVDGLRDPEAYFRRLRREVGEIYIVAEKILSSGERLRWWPVQGTTGYDFLNQVNGLFCRTDNKGAMDRVYRDFTGCKTDPGELLYEKKKLVMDSNLKPDLDNLARWLWEDVRPAGAKCGGFPEQGRLREALVEMMAQLPVYRTYLSRTNQSWHDGVPLAEALGRAESKRPDLLAELGLLAGVLMGAPRLAGGPDLRAAAGIDFAMTLQQYTGAVMAKGFEDTFLYTYNRLISLNEVGGDPVGSGTDLTGFHAFHLDRSASYPHSMNATSTHDTKRGEDVRARINVLSEIPEEWDRRVNRWAELNAASKMYRAGAEIPDRNDEYLLYQTLVGSWPFQMVDLSDYTCRVARYVRKVAREAKVHTGWHDGDRSYEDAFAAFAEAILNPCRENAFLADFLPFQKRIAHYGVLNSLSQTLIKICTPGVPDFYQGSELWDLSLVDPDNRRPVDFDKRARMLERLAGRPAAAPAAGDFPLDPYTIADGWIKMFLINRVLAVRRSNPYLFGKGAYCDLRTAGEHAQHVIAFGRMHAGSYAICIAPRFLTGLVGQDEFPIGAGVWRDTRIAMPPGAQRRWRDAVAGQVIEGGEEIFIGDALSGFPVSLLLEDSG